MGIKIKQVCEECKKKKILYAKGKCRNCYRRLMYRNLSKKEKKRRYNVSKIYREKNKEKIRGQMRDIMRKRLNIKPQNYYKKKMKINNHAGISVITKSPLFVYHKELHVLFCGRFNSFPLQ